MRPFEQAAASPDSQRYWLARTPDQNQQGPQTASDPTWRPKFAQRHPKKSLPSTYKFPKWKSIHFKPSKDDRFEILN
jgi:hypothetical protein